MGKRTSTTFKAGSEAARAASKKAAEARKAALIANPSNPTIKMTLRTFIRQGITEEIAIEIREIFFSILKDPTRMIAALQYLYPIPKSEIEGDDNKNVVSDQDMEIIKWFRSLPIVALQEIQEIALKYEVNVNND